MQAWLLELLRCPACSGSLLFDASADGDGILRHASTACPENYPVIGGIPRIIRGSERARLVRARAEWFTSSVERAALSRTWSTESQGGDQVVAAFDFEWSAFAQAGTPEFESLADNYFDLVPAAAQLPRSVVLDAGCGAGRWALEVARRGPRVIALDLGLSIELAAKNTRSLANVACVQADIAAIPVADAAVDWAYSLGVVHHVADPSAAIQEVARVVRPGGVVLAYVYYSLRERGLMIRAIFRVIDSVRRVTSRAPRRLVWWFSVLMAALVYMPLARTAALIRRLGRPSLAAAIPLSFYANLPFRVMVNDSLDRFGTVRELRFSRQEFVRLMEGAGLADVHISPLAPFWHGVGTKAASAKSSRDGD